MPYMISSRSVTDGVSLSVSKSKLVYRSLIFVDNKLTFIVFHGLETADLLVTPLLLGASQDVLDLFDNLSSSCRSVSLTTKVGALLVWAVSQCKVKCLN